LSHEGGGSESSDPRNLVIGLLLFGGGARVIGFFQNASLTGDEAMLALNIGRRSFTQLLHPLAYSQIATVPFLWIERLAVVLGGVSAYSLRVAPLLMGIILLWAVYRLTVTALGPLIAVVALGLTATAYPLIRYSVEVKPYVLDALAAVLLMQTAVRLMRDLADRHRWVLFAVSSAIAILVSTPALLVCEIGRAHV